MKLIMFLYLILYLSILFILYYLYIKGLFLMLILIFFKEEKFRMYSIIFFYILYIIICVLYNKEMINESFDYYQSMLSLRTVRRMSTLNSATNIVDSLILNPKSDFGFKDMEPGKIYYIVGKSLKISSEHFSEPYKKFHKFLEAGNYCLSFFSSFDSVTDVTGESRLHPMLFKLYIDSNNEWMLDVRIFTSQKIVDNCNKYKWTTFISDFYLNGKEAKAFVNQEEVGQYIRNIGFRIRLNKDLTVLENIYQITGSTINFLDMTNFNNIFSIKYFQYKSFGNYLINFVEPKLKDQPFFKIIEIDGKLNFFIENTDKISLEYKCCKSGNSAYLKKLKK